MEESDSDYGQMEGTEYFGTSIRLRPSASAGNNGERIVIESILGTTFSVSIAERLSFGGKEAIIPFVTGSASITGRSEFWIALDDPLYKGFILR